MRRAPPTAALAPVVAVLTLVVAGCGQILGVADYRTAAPPESDASIVAALPKLPALPDGSRIRQCTDCVRTSCASQREVCLGSVRCKALLACEGLCNQPNCLARCTDALPPSPDFDDYFACAFGVGGNSSPTENPNASQCSVQCGPGQNFECAGKYAWDPRASGGEVTLDLQIRDVAQAPRGPLTTLAGTEVAACEDFVGTGSLSGDSGCSLPWRRVDSYGAVRGLKLIPSQTSIAISGGDGEHHRVYPRPIARSTSFDVWVLGDGADFGYLQYALASFTNYDSALGLVGAALVDCLDEPANARIELKNVVGSTRFIPNLVPDTTDASGNAAIFLNVPPGAAVEIQGFVGGGSATPLGDFSVVVAGGWMTSVRLYPYDSNHQ